MTAPAMDNHDRLLDLLADRASEGLADAEARELDRLLVGHPGVDADSMDLAAAALDEAFAPAGAAEPLPSHLRAAVQADALRRLPAAPRTQRPAASPLRFETRTPDSRVSPLAYAGWVAAAACLVLAVVVWSTRPAVPSGPAGSVRLADARSQLLRTAPDVITADWADLDILDQTGRGATGDVVWSTSAQGGYMRFRGLTPNDPGEFQYQLWIFQDDPAVEATPVHGGVFDIAAGEDEAIVPIDPKIKIGRPVAFAVTVERPGGVWVSSRERIATLAVVK